VTSFDLIIFDCDGVLVDSERLAVRTEVEILRELGWPLSHDEVVERFVGRSAAYMQSEIERVIGRPVDWEREVNDRHRTVFHDELAPVDGVVDLLAALTTPTCVATSGTPDAVRYSLGLTGLLPQFAGRIFTASEVAQGKPAPDLFVHAATMLGVSPLRCAVVEDSVPGVTGGLAAGMTVFAYGGGVTSARALALDGVTVVTDMAELVPLLAL
jgi:HAD superfamily hydrolase (TIGR01509 family)